MNKHVHIVLLLMIALMAPGILMSQDAGVVYLEGWPSLRSGGSSRELDFGLAVRPGDSVLTGRRDFVELDQGGNTIRINADTVFTLREIERGGRRETVMTNTVGSVAYRFQTLAGRQQQVGTTTAVAGVRGTEFTVYAGSDGSSLFLVDTGLIEVESAGISVEVTADQGVEVLSGAAPGPVFERLGRPLDFSDWNQERIDATLDSPADAARRIQARLRFFQDEMTTLYALLEERREDLTSAREAMAEQRETLDDDALRRFRRDNIDPITAETRVLFLNYRYHALSALSLRRYVLGSMYMQLKSRYILNPRDPKMVDFLAIHREILDEFEETTVPRLVPADI